MDQNHAFHGAPLNCGSGRELPAPFRANQTGMALATALCISVFLLVVGLAFLTFMSSDYYAMGRVNLQTQAFYLAKGGMEYWAVKGTTADVYIPLNNHARYCRITQDGVTKALTFEGKILNTPLHDTVLAQRTIVVPNPGDLSQWFEPNR